jgi:hypothetical protein
MSWHDFYRFWVSQQTLPGNILGDVLIAIGAFLVGKFKIAPWLKERHREHLEQKERHHEELLAAHRELLESHKRLFDLHVKQHKELLAARDDSASR